MIKMPLRDAIARRWPGIGFAVREDGIDNETEQVIPGEILVWTGPQPQPTAEDVAQAIIDHAAFLEANPPKPAESAVVLKKLTTAELRQLERLALLSDAPEAVDVYGMLHTLRVNPVVDLAAAEIKAGVAALKVVAVDAGLWPDKATMDERVSAVFETKTVTAEQSAAQRN